MKAVALKDEVRVVLDKTSLQRLLRGLVVNIEADKAFEADKLNRVKVALGDIGIEDIKKLTQEIETVQHQTFSEVK